MTITQKVVETLAMAIEDNQIKSVIYAPHLDVGETYHQYDDPHEGTGYYEWLEKQKGGLRLEDFGW